jgi:hypothetical protein
MPCLNIAGAWRHRRSDALSRRVKSAMPSTRWSPCSMRAVWP